MFCVDYRSVAMASVLDPAELIDSEDLTAFNLAVWQEVLADTFLAGTPHRIETDRYGHIIMSPPPSPEHGEEQFEIGSILKSLLLLFAAGAEDIWFCQRNGAME